MCVPLLWSAFLPVPIVWIKVLFSVILFSWCNYLCHRHGYIMLCFFHYDYTLITAKHDVTWCHLHEFNIWESCDKTDIEYLYLHLLSYFSQVRDFAFKQQASFNLDFWFMLSQSSVSSACNFTNLHIRWPVLTINKVDRVGHILF